MFIRRLGKIVGRVVLGLLVVILVVSVGGYLYARRSLPTVDGVIKVPGLSAAVEIRRDRDAVAHIYGQNRQDVYFGLGYVHAQDRLWQMEVNRRTGQGRLSEILGSGGLSTDRYIRTTGMHLAAQRAWNDLPDEAKVDVNAYVAGINAFINTHGDALPPEFMALGYKPEPWTGTDVVLWAKVLSWGLGGALVEDELLRSSLIKEVGPERAAQLIPDYAPDGLSVIPPTGRPPNAAQETWRDSLARVDLTDSPLSRSYEQLGAMGEETLAQLQLSEASITGTGSNVWVVSGAKSTTGKPLLANDPHLTSLIPSRWYVAQLVGGDLDVIGATIPGMPGVVIGRNRSISWGLANNHLDIADLFRERLDPSGTMAEFQGKMEPLTIITETIKVKGQPDVLVKVRSSRHGPLISDAIVAIRPPGSLEAQLPPLEPLALKWIGLLDGDRTIAAFLKLNRAQNWQSFQEALRDIDGPATTFLYADVAGNIGFYLPGRVPLRPAPDPSIPIEGWSGRYEWTGWVPFEQMPHSYNPPEQFIAASNNRPFDLSYPYFLGRGWLIPDRAQRVTDLLKAKDKLSPKDFAAMQVDTVSLMAQELLPELLNLATPQTDQERQAVGLLRDWNYDMSGDSAAATIFAAWFESLPRLLIEDEIGVRLTRRYKIGIETFAEAFMINTLRDRNNPWCDNVKTEPHEDCAAVVNAALQAGVQKLQQKMGNDLSTWRWGRVHNILYTHQPFTAVPVIGPFLDRQGSYSGTWATVNIGNPALEANFEQYQGPSYRQIIDMSSTQNDLFISAIGQSGNILSPHYDDYLADLLAGRYRPMRFDRQDVERDQQSLLRLEP